MPVSVLNEGGGGNIAFFYHLWTQNLESSGGTSYCSGGVRMFPLPGILSEFYTSKCYTGSVDNTIFIAFRNVVFNSNSLACIRSLSFKTCLKFCPKNFKQLFFSFQNLNLIVFKRPPSLLVAKTESLERMLSVFRIAFLSQIAPVKFFPWSALSADAWCML